MAILLEELDSREGLAAAECPPDDEFEEGAGAPARLFCMLKACLVCATTELQTHSAQVLLLLGSSSHDTCDRLLEVDICEYLCEGLRICSSFSQSERQDHRQFIMETLELLRLLAPAATFAAHFQYGYDTICKLLEAAVESNDSEMELRCLNMLCTSLEGGQVCIPSHAAVKRTVTVAMQVLPTLSETAGGCALEPIAETLETWCVACKLIELTCQQVSGHIPKALCRIFTLALERCSHCSAELEDKALLRYFPFLISSVVHIAATVLPSAVCTALPSTTKDAATVDAEPCFVEVLFQSVQKHLFPCFKRQRNNLNCSTGHLFCRILHLALLGPENPCACHRSLWLTTSLLQGGILEDIFMINDRTTCQGNQPSSDCWALLLVLVGADFHSCSHLDPKMLSPVLTSIDSVLSLLIEALPPQLEKAFPNGILQELALTVIYLSCLHDTMLQGYDLQTYVKAFLAVNQRLIGQPAIAALLLRLITVCWPNTFSSRQENDDLQEVWAALNALDDVQAVKLAPDEPATGTCLAAVQLMCNFLVRVINGWMSSHTLDELVSKMAHHSGSLNAVLFLASQERLGPEHRENLLSLAVLLLSNKTQMVRPESLEAFVSSFYREVLAVTCSGTHIELSLCRLPRLLCILTSLISQQPESCNGVLALQIVQQVCCMIERLYPVHRRSEEIVDGAFRLMLEALQKYKSYSDDEAHDVAFVISLCSPLVQHIEATIVEALQILHGRCKAEDDAGIARDGIMLALQMSTQLMRHADGMYKCGISACKLLLLGQRCEGDVRAAALSLLDMQLKTSHEAHEKIEHQFQWDARHQSTHRGPQLGLGGGLCMLQHMTKDDHPGVRSTALDCLRTIAETSLPARSFLLCSAWTPSSLRELLAMVP
eukprot:jgi/Botrbrau1/4855/Bobra.0032s0015.2